MDYCKKIENELKNSDIRVSVDERNEKIGKKIRDTEMKKIPYMLIVGEKEMIEEKVAVRKQSEGDQGSLTLAEFINQIKIEIKETIQ